MTNPIIQSINYLSDEISEMGMSDFFRIDGNVAEQLIAIVEKGSSRAIMARHPLQIAPAWWLDAFLSGSFKTFKEEKW